MTELLTASMARSSATACRCGAERLPHPKPALAIGIGGRTRPEPCSHRYLSMTQPANAPDSPAVAEPPNLAELSALAAEARAWPFEEARKLALRFQSQPPEKGYALFETGYGPSGLPHLGTFGEVARTSMVRRAFAALRPDIPTRLVCVSDDMDGLRKVPEQHSQSRGNAGPPRCQAGSDPLASIPLSRTTTTGGYANFSTLWL